MDDFRVELNESLLEFNDFPIISAEQFSKKPKWIGTENFTVKFLQFPWKGHQFQIDAFKETGGEPLD